MYGACSPKRNLPRAKLRVRMGRRVGKGHGRMKPGTTVTRRARSERGSAQSGAGLRPAPHAGLQRGRSGSTGSTSPSRTSPLPRSGHKRTGDMVAGAHRSQHGRTAPPRAGYNTTLRRAQPAPPHTSSSIRESRTLVAYKDVHTPNKLPLPVLGHAWATVGPADPATVAQTASCMGARGMHQDMGMTWRKEPAQIRDFRREIEDGGDGLRATFEGKSLEGVAAQEGIMEGRRIVTTVTPSHLRVTQHENEDTPDEEKKLRAAFHALGAARQTQHEIAPPILGAMGRWLEYGAIRLCKQIDRELTSKQCMVRGARRRAGPKLAGGGRAIAGGAQLFAAQGIKEPVADYQGEWEGGRRAGAKGGSTVKREEARECDHNNRKEALLWQARHSRAPFVCGRSSVGARANGVRMNARAERAQKGRVSEVMYHADLWARDFDASRMSLNPEPMIHQNAIYACNGDTRLDLKLLARTPNCPLPGNGNGLLEAHRKLSDYYYKFDQSPYYTWAALLDPRISYDGLRADFEGDDDLIDHLKSSKDRLESHFHMHYANKKSPAR
ncbi:hypothetical protein B0H19DRAFT_1233584 [Mycena capillaripes]|nr:hypothetical protein B0H19DRAFT_1233584 [Mycena capillaripes]